MNNYKEAQMKWLGQQENRRLTNTELDQQMLDEDKIKVRGLVATKYNYKLDKKRTDNEKNTTNTRSIRISR